MASGTKDYYEILGVERGATDDEIKRAFRKKARETHPDVASHDGAEEAFKEVNEAYEVLSDPRRREMYDRFGTTTPGAGDLGGQGFGFDISDIFGMGMDEVFTSFFGGAAANARVRTEGRDMGAHLGVTLQEAASGVVKEVDVTRDAPCEECEGSGTAEGGFVSTCPDCRGTGQKRVGRRTFLGVVETVTTCDRCAGSGSVVDNPCPACSGTGRARKTEQVSVDIPAGVVDGMTLRVGGMGEAGVRGAKPGDLLVTVRVAPHEFLHREGDDLHVRVGVTFSQAALGDEIEIDGIEGAEELRIPEGSQYGDVVRLRGRGMPRLRGAGRGDLVAHLHVEVPKRLSKRQRELLHELGETFGDPHKPSALHRLKDWLHG